ncbi:hypothetical protein F4808DRAFT_445559 [Astrocystis sublimbata]|nr:hypothetical protein F4808DRAFT_445559 [Astrocystis sublimbata]
MNSPMAENTRPGYRLPPGGNTQERGQNHASLPEISSESSGIKNKDGRNMSRTPRASPPLGIPCASEPNTLGVQYRSEHVKIIHWHRPITPGSKSCPIKVEDEEDSSSVKIEEDSPRAHFLPHTPNRKSPSSRELHEPFSTLPKGPAIPLKKQTADAQSMGNDDVGGSSLKTFATCLGVAKDVKSIVASPKTAIAFLGCFLSSEPFWRKSRDHDRAPDREFWMRMVSKFNTCGHRHRITWQTARTLALTLCGRKYRNFVLNRLERCNERSRLAAILYECRGMSNRRKRVQQQSTLKATKDMPNDYQRITAPTVTEQVDGSAVRQEPRRDVLERKPRTLEDREKLLQTLSQTISRPPHAEEQEKNGKLIDNQRLEQRVIQLEHALMDFNGHDLIINHYHN